MKKPDGFDDFLVYKPITSAVVQLVKIGYIPRSEANRKSETLGEYFAKRCEDLGIKVSYDITYGGHPHEIRYSEFFAGIGGIQVAGCDGKLVSRMFNRPYDESNNIDFCKALDLRNLPNNDKYTLHTYDIERMKGLVILPGSNVLEKLIDKEKLNAAVLLGAKVKMHPLTNKAHKDIITQEYGEINIIPTMYSGYKAMLEANCIYTTGSSELGLYAMLLGKPVIDISSGAIAGGYYDAYSRVVNAPDQKAELNQLLNNPASGIIIPGGRNTHEVVNEWLEIYQEMLSDHKTATIPPLARHRAT